MMNVIKQYAPNIIQLLIIAAINVGVYVASIQYMSAQITELRADSKLYREELNAIRLQIANQSAINDRVTKLERKMDLVESENLRFWREDWPRIERIITEVSNRRN
jgi:Tfp pilus assembly protein PilO